MAKTSFLVLVRHGQSQWNADNKFTGWYNCDLTDLGIDEARNAGISLSKFQFKSIFTSTLKRAQITAKTIQGSLKGKSKELELIISDELKERSYGDLMGLNKADVKEKYGKDQLQIWRRSFDVAPPNGESLADVVERVSPYYYKNIAPIVESGSNVLIAAHGNSLRALLVVLGLHSKEEISQVEIPTAKPILIKFIDGKIESYERIC